MAQHLIRLGKSRNHESVPTGQDFIIAAGFHPLFADGEECVFSAGDQLRCFVHITLKESGQLCHFQRGMEDVLVLEISDIRDIVIATEYLPHIVAQYPHHFVLVPNKELAFHAFRVGILG